MDGKSDLIDAIYEAAIVPEKWKVVLDGLAEIADGEGTMLFSLSERGEVDWISSPAIHDFTEYWVSSEWVARNVRGARLIPIREPRFLTDLDAFTLEEMDGEPFYTEFLRPLGLGWCVGTAIHSPGDDTLVFSAEKRHAKGPVDKKAIAQLDLLRPHLARAALLSGRAGLNRAQITVDTLQTVGFGAAVLTHAGRVVAANRRLEDFAPALSIGAREAIQFDNPNTHAVFAEALEAMRGGSAGSLGRSVPVARTASTAAMVAHLIPLRGAARDIFTGASVLLFVSPVTMQHAPPARVLEALFDLTPTEAKVASLLVEGRSVVDIARANKVSANTIRIQLKSVFAKTGARRQAELVSLLAITTPGRE